MTPLSVSYFFGMPRTASYKSRMLDIKENLKIARHNSNDMELTRQYQFQTGIMSSYLESNIMDQFFLKTPGTSISTIEILNLVNQQGIPILRVDVANSAVLLPTIALNAEERAEIQTAINAGKVVTVPQQRIAHNTWNGTGYIIEDPVTGSGAFKISGGRNGGDSPAPETVYPLPSIPATFVTTMLIGMSLKGSPAEFMVKDGAFTGIYLGASVAASPTTKAPPQIPSWVGALVMALMFVAAIAEKLPDLIDRLYPKMNKVFRHYTNYSGAFGITASNLIWTSYNKEGIPALTHGEGVYLADNSFACILPPISHRSRNCRRIL